MTNTFEIGVEYTSNDVATLILVPCDLLYKFALNNTLFKDIDHKTIDRPLLNWFYWDTNPDHTSRSKHPLKFKPSRAEMDGNSVYFSGGRHRAKWLITKQLPRIPVLMYNRSLGEAQDKGLVRETVTGDQRISIPTFNFNNVLRINGDIGPGYLQHQG